MPIKSQTPKIYQNRKVNKMLLCTEVLLRSPHPVAGVMLHIGHTMSLVFLYLHPTPGHPAGIITSFVYFAKEASAGNVVAVARQCMHSGIGEGRENNGRLVPVDTGCKIQPQTTMRQRVQVQTQLIYEKCTWKNKHVGSVHDTTTTTMQDV